MTMRIHDYEAISTRYSLRSVFHEMFLRSGFHEMFLRSGFHEIFLYDAVSTRCFCQAISTKEIFTWGFPWRDFPKDIPTVQVDNTAIQVQAVRIRAVTKQPCHASHGSPRARTHHTPLPKHWSEPFSPLKGPFVLSVCGVWCAAFPRSWRVFSSVSS